MFATWLTLVKSSSSHVMKIAVLPAWYSGLLVIFGMNVFSQLSPVVTEQSCVSLHMFGVTKVNFAEVSGVEASGTSYFWQSVRMFVKYAAGLCLTAYCPEFDSRQFDGIDSWSERHAPPVPSWEKMLGAVS